MIEVLLWTKDKNGAPIDEVSLKCESFDESSNRLSYVSSRTKKGRKRQSWYSTYKGFSLSFVELPQPDKERLERIINEKEHGHQLFYNNAIYDIIIEGDTSNFTPVFSPTLGLYIYSGDLNLEEISSESDPLDSYMQSPIITFPIYKEESLRPEGYIVGGNPIEFYSDGFVSEDSSSYVSKFDFDTLTIYTQATYLIEPVANFQGAKGSSYGVVKNQKIDFYNDDAVSIMSNAYYKNDRYVASVNSLYESYHVGGEYFHDGSYINTESISKRDFETEEVSESSMVLSDDASRLMGTGNSQVGILVGGEYDTGLNTKVLKEIEYSTGTLSELAVELSYPRVGHATLTSKGKAYFLGGYDYENLAYLEDINSYDYSLGTMSVASSTKGPASCYYADGVNSGGLGVIVKNGMDSEIAINMTLVVDFNFDTSYSTLYSTWDYPSVGASCFQSGDGNY